MRSLEVMPYCITRTFLHLLFGTFCLGFAAWEINGLERGWCGIGPLGGSKIRSFSRRRRILAECYHKTEMAKVRAAGQFFPAPIVAISIQLAAAQSKPARQIAQEAFPSVALLVMQDGRGQPTALGSGFVLRDGLVATNRHVIVGAASGYAKPVGTDAKYEIAGTVAVDDANDLAIVAVTGLKAPALPLADCGSVAVGDDAYAVGNPQGLEGTFSQGIVSAIRRAQGTVRLQITAPISPGSSGGPILDNMGKVIGIAVAYYSGGQNLNLAIPSSYLTSLTNTITNEVRPLSQQVPRPENPPALDGLGSPGVAGVAGENFSWTHSYMEGGGGEFTLSLRNQLQ